MLKSPAMWLGNNSNNDSSHHSARKYLPSIYYVPNSVFVALCVLTHVIFKMTP